VKDSDLEADQPYLGHTAYEAGLENTYQHYRRDSSASFSSQISVYLPALYYSTEKVRIAAQAPCVLGDGDRPLR
jgi:hypothetical protein